MNKLQKKKPLIRSIIIASLLVFFISDLMSQNNISEGCKQINNIQYRQSILTGLSLEQETLTRDFLKKYKIEIDTSSVLKVAYAGVNDSIIISIDNDTLFVGQTSYDPVIGYGALLFLSERKKAGNNGLLKINFLGYNKYAVFPIDLSHSSILISVAIDVKLDEISIDSDDKIISDFKSIEDVITVYYYDTSQKFIKN